MKKDDVVIGSVYVAKVSGKIARLRIVRPHPIGKGWLAKNEVTGRSIHVRSAARLRCLYPYTKAPAPVTDAGGSAGAGDRNPS